MESNPRECNNKTKRLNYSNAKMRRLEQKVDELQHEQIKITTKAYSWHTAQLLINQLIDLIFMKMPVIVLTLIWGANHYITDEIAKEL